MQNNDFMEDGFFGGEETLSLDDILGGSLFDNLISQIRGGDEHYGQPAYTESSDDSDVDGGFFGDSSESEYGSRIESRSLPDSDEDSAFGGEDREEHSGGEDREEHSGGEDREEHSGGEDREEHSGGEDREDIKSLTIGSDDEFDLIDNKEDVGNFIKERIEDVGRAAEYATEEFVEGVEHIAEEVEEDVKSIIMESDNDIESISDKYAYDAQVKGGYIEGDSEEELDVPQYSNDDYPSRSSSPGGDFLNDGASTRSHPRTMSMVSSTDSIFNGGDDDNEEYTPNIPLAEKSGSGQKAIKVSRSTLVDYDGYEEDPLVVYATEINSNVDEKEQEHLLEVAGDIVNQRSFRTDNILPQTGGFSEIATAIANKYFA
jgi:hypothetical protein